MSRQGRQNPPSHRAIREQWINNPPAGCPSDVVGIVFDSLDETCSGENICWGCGSVQSRSLERCHIVPYSLGGSNEPSNYFLMCSKCHREAPNTMWPEIFYEWIQQRETAFSALQRSIIDAIEPFSQLITEDNITELVAALKENYTASVMNHNGVNEATRAGYIRHTLKMLLCKPQ